MRRSAEYPSIGRWGSDEKYSGTMVLRNRPSQFRTGISSWASQRSSPSTSGVQKYSLPSSKSYHSTIRTYSSYFVAMAAGIASSSTYLSRLKYGSRRRASHFRPDPNFAFALFSGSQYACPMNRHSSQAGASSSTMTSHGGTATGSTLRYGSSVSRGTNLMNDMGWINARRVPCSMASRHSSWRNPFATVCDTSASPSARIPLRITHAGFRAYN